jgi:hypothetical protein
VNGCQAAIGGPVLEIVNSCCHACCQGQSVGRCSSRRRAERARRAGTLISWARMVAVLARAWKVEARVPEARTERGRRPDPGEQLTHPAMAQQVHVIDRVRASDHPGHQRRHLRAGFAAPSPNTVILAATSPVQPAPRRQRQHRRQPRTRHEIRITETADTPELA